MTKIKKPPHSTGKIAPLDRIRGWAAAGVTFDITGGSLAIHWPENFILDKAYIRSFFRKEQKAYLAALKVFRLEESKKFHANLDKSLDAPLYDDNDNVNSAVCKKLKESARGLPNVLMTVMRAIPCKTIEEIRDAMVRLALAGDTRAAELLFKHISNSSNTYLAGLLRTRTAVGLSESLDLVIDAMAEGNVDVEYANHLMGLLNVKREFILTGTLEDKLKALADRDKKLGIPEKR